MIQFDADREPLDVLAEEFAQRCRRGETPSVSEYAARYPQWSEELQGLLPSVAKMEACRRTHQTTKGARPGLAPLSRVGDYHLLREIGRGGMGIVYEAEQESLGRRVAVKVLPWLAMLDGKKIERFHREAQAAARLHHTNIVPVFGVGEVQGLPYYVMQLIEGTSLDARLAGIRHCPNAGSTDGPVPLTPLLDPSHCRWAARVASQVAQALAYAHGQGVLHRDIKPANLIVDDVGTVWITDFGLAKVADQTDLTRTGDIVGTLQYLAPEILRGQVDARSDVYSLGLTLYELVTLVSPFRQSHPAKLLESLRRDEPIRPRKLNPEIPRDLETIVLKAIAPEPAQRYQTAQALQDDLQNFLDDRQISARRTNPGERLWRWCRRNRALASLTGAALAALLLAAVVGWVGYAKTQAALAGEARQTHEALRATERAEANVDLSLAAFESMFNYITRRRATLPPRPSGSMLRTANAGQGSGAADDAVLLQSILEFYERFAASNATNAQLQVEAAKAYRRVAELHHRLGKPAEAEAPFSRALTLLERVVQHSPLATPYRYELAETYAAAEPSSDGSADLAQAEQRLRHALDLTTELEKLAVDLPRAQALRAHAEGQLGLVLQRQKRNAEAEAAYRRALTRYQAFDPHSPTIHFEAIRAGAIRLALADLLEQTAQPREAIALLQDAVPQLQGLIAAHAGFRPLLVLLGEHYQALAGLFVRRCELELAADVMRKAELLRQQRLALRMNSAERPAAPREGQQSR